MSKKVPAWQRNGWKKPGPKAPHSANYVKAKDAKHMKTGLRQPGQWVENIDDSRPSRVLFTDSAEDRNSFRPVSIHLHPGDERRGSVAIRHNDRDTRGIVLSSANCFRLPALTSDARRL